MIELNENFYSMHYMIWVSILSGLNRSKNVLQRFLTLYIINKMMFVASLNQWEVFTKGFTRALRKALRKKNCGIDIKIFPNTDKISYLLDNFVLRKTNLESSCKPDISAQPIDFCKSSLTFFSEVMTHDRQIVSSTINIDVTP